MVKNLDCRVQTVRGPVLPSAWRAFEPRSRRGRGPSALPFDGLSGHYAAGLELANNGVPVFDRTTMQCGDNASLSAGRRERWTRARARARAD